VHGRKILALFLAATFVLTVSLAAGAGQKLPPQAAEKVMTTPAMDGDRNRVFDDLDKIMSKKGPNEGIPVIVMLEQGRGPKDLTSFTGKVDPKFEFAAINGFAATMNKGQIERLSHVPWVVQVEYDHPVYATLDTATAWFGAQKARTDFGVTGDRTGNETSYTKDDIVVAIIDTGIDPNHVDLNGGKIIAWKDYVNSQTTPYDDHGHGTHCASIATGEGEGNPLYKGVAPGAALVGVKVLDSAGSGSMANVDAGIQWCITNKATYGIEIISLSLGTSGSSDGTDSTSQMVNSAFNNGLVPCVAAGNSGPARYTIGSPGAAANAITVAAMADVGELGFQLASFSSRGPTADNRMKPDIAAPGVNIMAAKKGTTNQYVSMNGTSMATPFTAGTCALILDANPALTPAQVRSTLTGTAIDWAPAGQDVDYGFGRLDVYAAVKSAGGYTGTGPAVPNHAYTFDSLSGTGVQKEYTYNVTSTAYPISITLIMPNWSSSSSPNFDLYLFNPAGTQIASSTTTKRQDQVGVTITTTGNYKVRVKSTAGSGNFFFDISAALGTIDNPPTCSIAQPANGATVSGTYRVKMSAADDVGLSKVEARIDSGTWVDITANFDGTYYFYDWDTTAYANGSHTVNARATDTATQVTNATPVTVTVSNGADNPPTCSIAQPANGATVSGTYRIKVSAADDVGLSKVETQIDSGSWVNITANFDGTYYFYDWVTTGYSNGSHTINARATDTATQVTNATPVTVTVQNGGGGNQHTLTFNGTVTSTARDAWFNVNVASVGYIFSTLNWNTTADLDFFVYGPSGAEVGRAYTISKPETLRVYTDTYGTGLYRIKVNLYSGVDTSFTLTVDGYEKKNFNGYVDLLTPDAWVDVPCGFTGNSFFSLNWDGIFDDLDFYIYDPAGTYRSRAYTIWKPETLWQTIDMTGTWRVKVNMYFGIADNFVLTVYVPEDNLY